MRPVFTVILAIIGIVAISASIYWVFVTITGDGTIAARPYVTRERNESNVTVTPARLQYILESFPEKTKLPEKTAILVKFFGREDEYLLSGREFEVYNGEDYDLVLETGDYYLDDLEEDTCMGINKIMANQDYLISRNKNVVSLSIKYGSLLKFKNICD